MAACRPVAPDISPTITTYARYEPTSTQASRGVSTAVSSLTSPSSIEESPAPPHGTAVPGWIYATIVLTSVSTLCVLLLATFIIWKRRRANKRRLAEIAAKAGSRRRGDSEAESNSERAVAVSTGSTGVDPNVEKTENFENWGPVRLFHGSVAEMKTFERPERPPAMVHLGKR